MIEAGRGHAERDWFCLLGRQVLLFVKLLRFPLRFSVVAWAQQPAPTAPASAVCSSRGQRLGYPFNVTLASTPFGRTCFKLVFT